VRVLIYSFILDFSVIVAGICYRNDYKSSAEPKSLFLSNRNGPPALLHVIFGSPGHVVVFLRKVVK
jgi:hypothetical protein